MTTRSILVIDDDDDIRDIVQFSLEIEPGWTVVGDPAGERAVNLAAETRPDVILLDVNLSGMDGPTVLAALRADDRTRSVPVIFLTANTRPADVDRLRALGAAAVIAKPFDPLALAGQVSAAMGWTA